MAQATMEKGSPLSSVLRITEERIASTFLVSPTRRLLLAFVDQPLSVSEAAARVGQPLERVHHHVISLTRKGLLRVVRQEKRKGRPIKYYRAAAESFFVPLALLHRSPGAGLAAELRASLDEELFRSPDDGILFFTEGGQPRVSHFGQSRTSNTAGEFWHIVSLPPDRVGALAMELKALMQKYEAVLGEGQPYLLHAAYAPRKDPGQKVRKRK
jgi:DNA-binding transcriptional ArsR family regulator